jgi:hypothetical protein
MGIVGAAQWRETRGHACNKVQHGIRGAFATLLKSINFFQVFPVSTYGPDLGL